MTPVLLLPWLAAGALAGDIPEERFGLLGPTGFDPEQPLVVVETPADPLAQPLASDLHVVRDQPVRRFLVLLDDRLAGPHAPVLFRDDMSYADAHWAIVAHGGTVLDFTDKEQKDLLESLAIAAGMASEDLVDETLHRSELLGAGDDVLRDLSSPSLMVVGHQDGNVGVRVGASDPRVQRDRFAEAAMLDASAHRPDVRPPPRLRTGSSLRVRDPWDDSDVPLVDASAFVAGDRMGLTAWRVSGLALSRQWIASARQSVAPGLDVTFQARSNPGTFAPGSWTVGTVTALPSPADGWQVRAWYSRTLPTPTKVDRDDKIGIEVVARWGWKAPQSPSGPGLGDRPDRDGPYVPGSDDLETQRLARLRTQDPVDTLMIALTTPRPPPAGDEEPAIGVADATGEARSADPAPPSRPTLR